MEDYQESNQGDSSPSDMSNAAACRNATATGNKSSPDKKEELQLNDASDKDGNNDEAFYDKLEILASDNELDFSDLEQDDRSPDATDMKVKHDADESMQEDILLDKHEEDNARDILKCVQEEKRISIKPQADFISRFEVMLKMAKQKEEHVESDPLSSPLLIIGDVWVSSFKDHWTSISPVPEIRCIPNLSTRIALETLTGINEAADGNCYRLIICSFGLNDIIESALDEKISVTCAINKLINSMKSLSDAVRIQSQAQLLFTDLPFMSIKNSIHESENFDELWSDFDESVVSKLNSKVLKAIYFFNKAMKTRGLLRIKDADNCQIFSDDDQMKVVLETPPGLLDGKSFESVFLSKDALEAAMERIKLIWDHYKIYCEFSLQEINRIAILSSFDYSDVRTNFPKDVSETRPLFLHLKDFDADYVSSEISKKCSVLGSYLFVIELNLRDFIEVSTSSSCNNFEPHPPLEIIDPKADFTKDFFAIFKKKMIDLEDHLKEKFPACQVTFIPMAQVDLLSYQRTFINVHNKGIHKLHKLPFSADLYSKSSTSLNAEITQINNLLINSAEKLGMVPWKIWNKLSSPGETDCIFFQNKMSELSVNIITDNIVTLAVDSLLKLIDDKDELGKIQQIKAEHIKKKEAEAPPPVMEQHPVRIIHSSEVAKRNSELNKIRDQVRAANKVRSKSPSSPRRSWSPRRETSRSHRRSRSPMPKFRRGRHRRSRSRSSENRSRPRNPLADELLSKLWERHCRESERYRQNPTSHPDYEKERNDFMDNMTRSMVYANFHPAPDEVVMRWNSFWRDKLEGILRTSWEIKREEAVKVFSRLNNARSRSRSREPERRRRARSRSRSIEYESRRHARRSRSRSREYRSRRSNSREYENKRSVYSRLSYNPPFKSGSPLTRDSFPQIPQEAPPFNENISARLAGPSAPHLREGVSPLPKIASYAGLSLTESVNEAFGGDRKEPDSNVTVIELLNNLLRFSKHLGTLGVYLTLMQGKAIEVQGSGSDPLSIIDDKAINLLTEVRGNLQDILAKPFLPEDEKSSLQTSLRQLSAFLGSNSEKESSIVEKLNIESVVKKTFGMNPMDITRYIVNNLHNHGHFNVPANSIIELQQIILAEHQKMPGPSSSKSATAYPLPIYPHEREAAKLSYPLHAPSPPNHPYAGRTSGQRSPAFSLEEMVVKFGKFRLLPDIEKHKLLRELIEVDKRDPALASSLRVLMKQSKN